MSTYNYLQAVTNDVINYVNNEINLNDFDGVDDLREKLHDDLWINDSVTGNASGSYTFSNWEAEENLCHNLDELKLALDEFGGDCAEALERGAEFCDVTIRCYLLGQAIDQAIDELELETYYEDMED